MTQKCSCGGTYERIEGLEGLWCDTCGANVPDFTRGVESSFTDDKLKSVRGVPVNRIIISSESKGMLEITAPIFLSFDEQKRLIDQQIALLEYTKSQIQAKNLDIMPKR